MSAESALLLAVPAAEEAVGVHRAALDRAARVGVPAHVTITYPFVPELTATEHRKLVELFSAIRTFTMVSERTGWFDDAVLFLEPADPTPIRALTAAVLAAFPEHPPYGGAFDEVVPHLTIGHDTDPRVLRGAERLVLAHLPIRQQIDHVELWSGPASATAPAGSWRHVRSYSLDPGAP